MSRTRFIYDPHHLYIGSRMGGYYDGDDDTLAPFKIYILIRESVDVGHAVNCAAHASLQWYLKRQDDTLVKRWLANSFRKVSCLVTDEEFEEAKTFGNYELITESTLPDPEVALVFGPLQIWNDFFKELPLYGKGKQLISDEQARILHSLPI